MPTDHHLHAAQLVRTSLVCDMTLPWSSIPGTREAKYATPDLFKSAGFDFITLTLASDDEDLAQVMQSIARERRHALDHPERFVLVETADDILRARREDKLAIGFHFQGSGPVGRNLELVETYYRLGIRHMLMAYNQKNFVGNGCHELHDDGLSRFGLALIAEMNRVGMMVDVAHCGYQTAMQTIEASAQPVIVSHGNVAALHKHPRCYTDDQIKAIAAKGGVIGLTGLSIFLGVMEDMCGAYVRSLDHVAQLVGPDHVGLGFDYVYDMKALTALARVTADRWPKDGGYGNPEIPQIAPGELTRIVAGLIGLGYSDGDIQKILGGNWLRVMRAVWK